MPALPVPSQRESVPAEVEVALIVLMTASISIIKMLERSWLFEMEMFFWSPQMTKLAGKELDAIPLVNDGSSRN